MKKIWTNLGKDYLYKFDEHDIAWHTRVLVNYDDGNSVVKSRHARDGNGLEIFVYSKNADNLFLKITNFLNANQLDVTLSKIFCHCRYY